MQGENTMIKRWMEQLVNQLKKVRYKWVILPIIGLIFLTFVGYMVILFGGRYVVKDEDLLLDAVTTIETKDGTVISEVFNERRYPVDIEHIPTHVQEAFISVEDQRFYEHGGIDHRSVVRAIIKDVLSFSKKEGASTITQQLVKNVSLTNDKSWTRKFKEIMGAVYIERKMTKDEILELYLNKVYFGRGVHGVEAAAQYYFSKSIRDVSLTEAALLAGLVKAPNGYSPIEYPEKALERRNVVLQTMQNHEVITAEERIQAQEKSLGLDLQQQEPTPFVDSYVDLVLKEASHTYDLSMNELKRGGYRIVVHMDSEIQQTAYEYFEEEEHFPGSNNDVQGAFVMMDQEHGNVVAAIGGRDYEQGDLNRVTVKKQPASVFKPLAVYGPALMDGNFTAHSVLPDKEDTNPTYDAPNANGEYAGEVSMYDALVQSKNVPAVWMLDKIGIETSKTYLDKMNMSIEDDGLAIALGGLHEGVTPLDLVGGYRAFAHGGSSIEPMTISIIFDADEQVYQEQSISEEKVFSAQVSWDMTEMLRYTVKHGTASAGTYTKDLAGKTGTTPHPSVTGMNKDAWFVGYTPEYVTAFWMGYDETNEENYLTEGSRAPTLATKDILTEIDQEKELASTFTKPEEVDGLEPPIRLGNISNVQASFTFGGFSIIKGKLEWKKLEDDRIVYRVYEVTEDGQEYVGEVEGEDSYTIDRVSFWNPSFYYVVPFDPLTNMEGTPSEAVQLSF